MLSKPLILVSKEPSTDVALVTSEAKLVDNTPSAAIALVSSSSILPCNTASAAALSTNSVDNAASLAVS